MLASLRDRPAQAGQRREGRGEGPYSENSSTASRNRSERDKISSAKNADRPWSGRGSSWRKSTTGIYSVYLKKTGEREERGVRAAQEADRN